MANDTATIESILKLAQQGKEAAVKKEAAQKKARNPDKSEQAEKALTDRIQWNGTKLTLPLEPSRMGVDEAITYLGDVRKDMMAEVAVHEVVDAFPLEGAAAFSTVLARRYGWAHSVPTPGFFGPRPPAIVSMPVGVNETRQIVWGSFEVPGIKGRLQTSTDEQNGRPVFVIGGIVLKGSLDEVKLIADEVRRMVREESVYRGQAINLIMNGGSINYNDPPTFMDTSRVDAAQVVFGPVLQRQIDTSIFAPLRYTDACRKAGIPLKRGVLLEGPYGCGKTLVSYVTAQEATKAGWTYISIKDARGLDEAIRFARLYQPAVVFCEDVDREVSGDERTHDLDGILNTIDGIESKGTDIMVVLTSNHASTINQAMLRPGRLDAVIHVAPPDAIAAARLVGIYGGQMIVAGSDLAPVGAALAGKIPAVIREVVERSKLFAISRAGGGEGSYVTTADLMDSANEMNEHLALLNKPRDEPSAGEKFAAAFRDVIMGPAGIASQHEAAEILELCEQIKNEVA